MATPRSVESITFREAEDRYATKIELAALGTNLNSTAASMQAQLNQIANDYRSMVPRTEHELRWRHDDMETEELKRLINVVQDTLATKADKANVDALAVSVDGLKLNRLPPWMMAGLVAVPAAIIGPIMTLLVAHFLK